MKPVRLELQGFTAFRGRTVVEFEGRKLFAITGPTGAGKSSLLDAMTWALYGRVPRVGSSTRQLVSHGLAAMYVRFDFVTRGGSYRVVRKAPATTGTRLEQQQADGSWRHLADRANDVTREVTRLLGMDFTTFTRTVLLPQGEFDAFLKGEQSERRAILTKLLGLGVYDDARKIAADRAKRAKERSATIEAQLAQLNLASPERIGELELEHAAAQQQLCVLTERRDALASLGDLARVSREANQALAGAEQTSQLAERAKAAAGRALTMAAAAVIEAERHCDQLSRDRAKLDYDPKQHQSLLGHVERIKLREAAERELGEARRKLEAVRAGQAAANEAASSAKQQLSAAEAAATSATAQLVAGTATLALAAGRARYALSGLEATVATATAELDVAKRERESLGASLPKLEMAAIQLKERTTAREAAQLELTQAGAERERAEQAAAGAQQQLIKSTTCLEQSQAVLTEARHADLAATIRAGLKLGDPCPVCGDPISQLPMEFGAVGIEVAEAAVVEAELTIEQHRQASTAAREAAAAAVARNEAAAATLSSVDALLAAIDEELARLETSRDTLSESLASQLDAHARAAKRESVATEAAVTSTSARDELRFAFAAVPREVEPADVDEGCADPVALTDSVERWGALRDAASVARSELDRSRAQHAQFEQAIASASARVEAAGDAAQQAEERLAGHGDTPGVEESTALREALAVAELASKRAEELDGQIAAAKAVIAGAIATRAAAESEQTRATDAATAVSDQLAAVRQAAEVAQAALTTTWSVTIGGEAEPSFEALRELMLGHEADQQTAAIKAGALGAQIEQSKREIVEAERMRGEVASDRAIADLSSMLAKELQGDRFVGYVQREAMQLLAADASYRLDGFTRGRYELASEDNEFLVVDRLNGDERRSVKTLSGGETFLASLALALSLSEHLPQLAGLGGAVSLESLFLDEGFGALDTESLDLAVQGLETIAGGHRMIGVISHVDEMAERLPERIEVVKRGNASEVRG